MSCLQDVMHYHFDCSKENHERSFILKGILYAHRSHGAYDRHTECIA
jgi:hypothetical protein